MTTHRRKSAIVIKCKTPTCKARIFVYNPEQPYEVFCPRCLKRRNERPRSVHA